MARKTSWIGVILAKKEYAVYYDGNFLILIYTGEEKHAKEVDIEDDETCYEETISAEELKDINKVKMREILENSYCFQDEEKLSEAIEVYYELIRDVAKVYERIEKAKRLIK